MLRFCIPDAPTGGGTSATLSLLVNGKFRQSLSLDSRHAYLYGEAGQNGQSNDPTQGQPHVFWDEMRCFLARGLKRGDTLRLQIGAGVAAGAANNVADKAAFYRIDLVDLEKRARAAGAATRRDIFVGRRFRRPRRRFER